MKETQIRRDDLMSEQRKLHAEDVQNLIKDRNLFEEVRCPACESVSHHPVFQKDGFTFVTCADCETLFINPRPTPEMLNRHYAESASIKYWNDKIFPLSEKSRRTNIFRPRAERVAQLCAKYRVGIDLLIDAGAGFGTFCEEIESLGLFKRVLAVEPAHSLAETCRAKGLNVVERPIEAIDLGAADVITNFELIEHLYRPLDFLLACGRALRPGGLFILTTPNIKGFDLLVLGRLSDNVGGPNHLNYFHPRSLRGLLRSSGFEVLEILTPGKLDVELVRKKILSGDLDISGQPFLRQVLADEWDDNVGEQFQGFLADNHLSSHLWVVARKA